MSRDMRSNQRADKVFKNSDYEQRLARLENALRSGIGGPGAPGAVASVTMDAWHVVGAAGEPGFTNGWANFSTGSAFPDDVAAFRKYPDGRVRLRGLVGHAPNTVMPPSFGAAFVLPAGYRPVGVMRFPVSSAAGIYGQVRIDPDGSVVPTIGNSSEINLSVIEFDTNATLWPAGAVQPIPVVTALPESPIAGQEVYFQNAAMALLGVRWHLVWDATLAKWTRLGGGKLAKGPSGSITTAASAVTVLTGGPTLVVPLTGVYEVGISISMQSQVANANNMIATVFSNSGAINTGISVTVVGIGTFHAGRPTLDFPECVLTAAHVLDVRVNSANAFNSTYAQAVLSLLPVRVN